MEPRQLVRQPVPLAALATLSHELKTPLVALLGFAQLLEADSVQPLTACQRERAERIEAASRQMLQIVDTVLQRAREGRSAQPSASASASADSVCQLCDPS